MINNRKPSGFLFPHTIDHYSGTASKEGGSQKWTFTLAKADIRCFVQEAAKDVVTKYQQKNIAVTQTVFIQNKDDFNGIEIEDRIVFGDFNYRVVGFGNSCNLDRVFSVDLAKEDRNRGTN